MTRPNTAAYVTDSEGFREAIRKNLGISEDQMLGYVLIVPTNIEDTPYILRSSAPNDELIKFTLMTVLTLMLTTETEMVSASDQKARYNGGS